MESSFETEHNKVAIISMHTKVKLECHNKVINDETRDNFRNEGRNQTVILEIITASVIKSLTRSC